ncbi:hypothetical protein DFJ77DRAFT_163676 [Powellomyces hirtus]|nr:hypothetical protein DFJ77DRAFT_163676 [Powellomyces hirtus]
MSATRSFLFCLHVDVLLTYCCPICALYLHRHVVLPPGPLYPTHPQPHLPAPRFGPDRNGSPEQLAAAAGASQQQQAREQGGAPLSASPYGAPGGIAVIPGISRDVLRAEHESVLLHHQQWQEAAPYWRPTTQSCAVYNMDRSKSYMLRLNPRVERGFFVADGDWTCYRRNYFQVSMGFSAIDHVGQRVELPCIVAVDGRFQTVTAFHVGITARTSNGQRQVELVQHTAKRDKGPQLVPESRLCQPQDSPNGYGLGSGAPVDTFHTVTFDRLQFKAATANNGKRRAAQQYHVLVAELYAEFSDKGRCRIAFTESAPLVVRGRAPGHYALMHHKTGSGGHASNDYPMSPGMDHAAGNTSSGDHQIPMTPPPPRGMVTGDESHSMHSRHTGLPPPSVLAGYPMHQAHHPQPHQQQSVYSPHPSSAGLAGSDPQQQYYQPQQQQGLPPLQQQQQPQLPPQQQQQQYPLYTPQHTAPHLSHRPPGPGDSHHAAHHHGGGAYGVDNRSAPGQPGTIQHRPLPHHLQQQERSSHHHSQHQQQQQYRDPGPYETAHQPQHQHPSQYSQHHQPHYPHQAYSQHQHPSEQGLEELGQYSSQHQQQQQPLQAQRPPSPQSGSAASASHHAHPSPAYPASNSVAAAGMSIPAAAAPVGREQDERQIQPQQQPLYRSRSPTPSGIPLHSYNTTEQQQQRQSQSSSQGLPHRHHHHQPHHHSSGGRSHGSEQDVQSSPQQQQQQQQQQQGPASSSAKPGSVAATRGRENGHQHDGSSNNVADHTHSDNKASNNTVAAQ